MIPAARALATLRALPIRAFDAIFGAAPILVLAPHADDESLGCGGMIAEACARGHEVHVAILTDGGMSHPNSPSWPAARLIAARMDEARAATSILGLPPERLFFMGLPDSQVPPDGPLFDAARETLSAACRARGIGTLCAPWIADPHCDHEAAALLAAAACLRLGIPRLSYPVWGWTLPDEAAVPPIDRGARLDVAAHLAAKRRAIAAHATQYSALIADDPTGFRLPASFLALFDGPWEYFIEETA